MNRAEVHIFGTIIVPREAKNSDIKEAVEYNLWIRDGMSHDNPVSPVFIWKDERSDKIWRDTRMAEVHIDGTLLIPEKALVSDVEEAVDYNLWNRSEISPDNTVGSVLHWEDSSISIA